MNETLSPPASRVGIRLVPENAADPAQTVAMVDAAVEAEAAGLEVVAVPERLGAGGVPAALPVCAAIAARTERIAIATALLPLPLHHPLRAAEDAATVDSLSAGRFELGIGLGADREDLAGFGLEAAERGDRFEEAVALLRAAWSDRPVDFEGQHFSVEGIEVFPKPARVGGPPLWVGAAAAGALTRAARLGLGVLIRPGTDTGVYFEAWSQGSEPSSVGPRVAITGEVSAVRAQATAQLDAGRPSADCWFDLAPEDRAGLERIARIANELRP